MKKILSLVLVVVMMMSMTVTAFAAGEQSGTSTVTAVVPKPVPEYTIHFPADMTLEYGNGEHQFSFSPSSDQHICGSASTRI